MNLYNIRFNNILLSTSPVTKLPLCLLTEHSLTLLCLCHDVPCGVDSVLNVATRWCLTKFTVQALYIKTYSQWTPILSQMNPHEVPVTSNFILPGIS